MKSDVSPLSSQYTEVSSSGYRSKGKSSSYQSRLASNSPSKDQSKRASQGSQSGRENIKLVPMKYKELMKMLQASSQYKDKTPIMINMKESEIDKIIERQHYHNSASSAQPQQSPRQSIQLSPMTLKQPYEQDYSFEPRQIFEPEYTSPNEQTSRSDQHPFGKESKPPLGESQAQVYAMTGIQAYPMVGTSGGAFKKRKGTPRKRSHRKIKSNRRKVRSRSRRPKSRSRSRGHRSKSRGRSRRRLSPRSKKIMRVQSSRRRPRTRPRVIVRRKRRPVSYRRRVISPQNTCCAPYPLCDYDCSAFTEPRIIESPYRRQSRRLIGQSTAGAACNCTLCEEKLQFIQPGVCSQKKNMWTNEYAIIPKPQVNLIDPCKELDPSIYPRADRPCIRDGRGNPLTDCIGRPLRDPVGKRFLNFNANGSVMDTNFRGNFFTGQPPLCVKCPMPDRSCAPDTTHNWWMSCGYPVKANMGPFFNNVVAAENAKRRC